MVVVYEFHTKAINITCEQHVKAGGTHSYHCALDLMTVYKPAGQLQIFNSF
jgi:hypothetical protein